jgi:hypothetical protein
MKETFTSPSHQSPNFLNFSIPGLLKSLKIRTQKEKGKPETTVSRGWAGPEGGGGGRGGEEPIPNLNCSFWLERRVAPRQHGELTIELWDSECTQQKNFKNFIGNIRFQLVFQAVQGALYTASITEQIKYPLPPSYPATK